MLLINLEKVNAQVGPDEALINTLIGMGTVFIVLILISIIIFLLKYIPKLFEKKAAETVRPERREVPIELPKSSSAREESNDTQIAAVIMAQRLLLLQHRQHLRRQQRQRLLQKHRQRPAAQDPWRLQLLCRVRFLQ